MATKGGRRVLSHGVRVVIAWPLAMEISNLKFKIQISNYYAPKNNVSPKNLGVSFQKRKTVGNTHLNIRFMKNTGFSAVSAYGEYKNFKESQNAILFAAAYMYPFKPWHAATKYDIALITKPSILKLNFANLKTTLHLLKTTLKIWKRICCFYYYFPGC